MKVELIKRRDLKSEVPRGLKWPTWPKESNKVGLVCQQIAGNFIYIHICQLLGDALNPTPHVVIGLISLVAVVVCKTIQDIYTCNYPIDCPFCGS